MDFSSNAQLNFDGSDAYAKGKVLNKTWREYSGVLCVGKLSRKGYNTACCDVPLNKDCFAQTEMLVVTNTNFLLAKSSDPRLKIDLRI